MAKKLLISPKIFNEIIHDITRLATELRKKKMIEEAKKLNNLRETFLSSLEQEE